jgi:hypothetical protein
LRMTRITNRQMTVLSPGSQYPAMILAVLEPLAWYVEGNTAGQRKKRTKQ